MPLENEDTPVTTATQTAIMAYRTLGIIVIAAAKILTTEKVSGTLIRSKNSSAAEFCALIVAQTKIRLKLYESRARKRTTTMEENSQQAREFCPRRAVKLLCTCTTRSHFTSTLDNQRF